MPGLCTALWTQNRYKSHNRDCKRIKHPSELTKPNYNLLSSFQFKREYARARKCDLPAERAHNMMGLERTFVNCFHLKLKGPSIYYSEATLTKSQIFV